jgi:hypothetical protein
VSDDRLTCFTENEAWSIAFALADAAELARDVVAFSSAARFERYYQLVGDRAEEGRLP